VTERERVRTQSREQTAQNIHVYTEHYEKERIYVRQVGSMRYSLAAERRERLDSVPRIIQTRLGDGLHENWHIIEPGNDVFRTQSLHLHFVTIQPNGRNDGHGHQNEALFYVLQGHGYETHDGKRYDWKKGDAVAVHNDCVHWHNNPDPEERAICLVMKPKPLSLFLGLSYQGKVGYTPENDHLWEPRSEWLTARPEGDEAIPKVFPSDATPFTWTPFGYTRQIAGEGVPLRIKGTDAYLHEIPAGSRSGRRWRMPDEMVYVMEGEGYDLHWDVEAEITDQYYARIAKKPSRWEWKEGDVIWVPQNTIVQRFNTGSGTARFVAASNRVFHTLGYSRIHYFENAPEYDARAEGGA
jgi:mannose-6-phosphate isomerase-like protein (cupin superfamily)